MGNTSNTKTICVSDIDSDRICRKKHNTRQTYSANNSEIGFEDGMVVVDWNDDESVKHRSAMNCLHNWAIGKMSQNDRLARSKSSSKRSMSNASIKFADILENTLIVNRSSLCMESWVADTPDQQEGMDMDCFGLNENM